MRIFQTEFGHAYGRFYAFGYTSYAELAPEDDPAEAYALGFLPYSTDPSVHNLLYLCRSVRVPLQAWSTTSENRRILKKFDGVFTRTLLSREALQQDPAFLDCFLAYFAGRHTDSSMPRARVLGILESALPLRGVRYDTETGPVAYVLEVVGETFIHYWYSCYDLAYVEKSLGMWLMLDSVRQAKAGGKAYAYLGTAYGDKGKYKMNLEPLEFWDGTKWNANPTLLKQRIKEDAERTVSFPDRLASP
ncbi:MAG TPA: GNAT family N-acetyltransferase [Candidatus Paceibacterota bacterium]|nr:GNAT family N-acetyltransferase [Candidatus Paceibacterota bacterium]